MKVGVRVALLTVATVASVILGVALVLSGNAAFTTAGIVLVILSAIVFLADVADVLLITDQRAGN